MATAICVNLGYAGGALGASRVSRFQLESQHSLTTPPPIRLRCGPTLSVTGSVLNGSSNVTLTDCGPLVWNDRECNDLAIAICTGESFNSTSGQIEDIDILCIFI